MMKIEQITTGMSLFEAADALRFSPDAHPDVWHKRCAELRNQGRDDEANIVEAEFPEYMSQAAAVAADKTTDMILRWAKKVTSE